MSLWLIYVSVSFGVVPSVCTRVWSLFINFLYIISDFDVGALAVCSVCCCTLIVCFRFLRPLLILPQTLLPPPSPLPMPPFIRRRVPDVYCRRCVFPITHVLPCFGLASKVRKRRQCALVWFVLCCRLNRYSCSKSQGSLTASCSNVICRCVIGFSMCGYRTDILVITQFAGLQHVSVLICSPRLCFIGRACRSHS